MQNQIKKELKRQLNRANLLWSFHVTNSQANHEEVPVDKKFVEKESVTTAWGIKFFVYFIRRFDKQGSHLAITMNRSLNHYTFSLTGTLRDHLSKNVFCFITSRT